MTTPSNSWFSGVDSNGMTTSRWSQSSSIFRVSRPIASSPTKPVIEFVKPSLLCSDSASYTAAPGTGGYGGNINTPQRVGNTWYTLQTTSTYSYGYDPVMG